MKVDFRQKQYLIDKPEQILKKVCELSRFEPAKLIYKGEVRRADWIGSLVYEGDFQGRDAILKIQGLKPEKEEPQIMARFMAQNKSSIIRAAKIYWHQPWNKKDKFGAFIMEKARSPQIFKYPYASKMQKILFRNFYDEFHIKALKEPWEKVPVDERTNIQFFQKRIKRLVEERPDIKLPREDKERIKQFSDFVDKKIKESVTIFTHGHLGADDIHFNGKEYIIMSNLAWGYKPECYDLVFIIWGCLHKIRDAKINLQKAQKLISDWFLVDKDLKYLKNVDDWELKVNQSLLYFVLASIVLQLYSDEHKRTASQSELDTLFKIHRQLFDNLYNQLNS
jgi:hypothetical protein